MASERARLQWDASVQARGHDNGPLRARDELNRFLVNLKMPGQPLSAAERGALTDEAGVEGAEGDDPVTRVEWGLSLPDVHPPALPGGLRVHGGPRARRLRDLRDRARR